ncbi:MAG TPA: hypothetical protein VFD27_17390 [Chthoniobacteraceae bacterium]|nr:hypothetical protein [Chthoniobacteraceae bacterium]
MRTLILLGGLVHFGILIASALTPGVLEWRRHLAALPPLLRQLFWVYGSFIVLVIISFGTISLACPGALASGEPLARSMCAMIAIFWSARLAVQWCIFDATPFLTNVLLKLGYHTLTLAFIALALIYGCAAVHPLQLPVS